MTGVRKGYVDTSFGQVHFRMAGTRDAHTPIVLLHQTASSSAMFEAVMTRLASSYFVFAPDTPGFGGTDAPRERATMETYARTLGEACARMEIPRAWLFGHHTGASIAVQMEALDPGFARRLALSGPPYLSPAAKEVLRAKTEPIVLDEAGEYLSHVWRRLRAKDANASRELLHREAVLTLHAGTRYHEAYDAVWNHDFEGQLARVACRTLVMAGDDDTLAPSLAAAFAALKHGTMMRIPNGTTYVVDRAPDTVADALRAFFVDDGSV